MSKATHYGICQACGAEQKLPNGMLSNHGYRVQWDYFEGTCKGSKKLPFELSCDYIKRCIEGAKASQEYFRKQIEETLANTTTSIDYHYYLSHREGRVWIKAQVVDGKIVSNERYYNDIPCTRLCLYGTDLEIARKLDQKRVKYLESQIKGLDGYISWQEERIVNWEEKELTPIK